MSARKVSNISKAFIAVAAFMLALLLGGCGQFAATQSNTEDDTPTSRSYMSELSNKTSDLKDVLAQFNDAVSREDVVSMRTHADNAFAIIDSMDGIEAPDDLSDLKKQYNEGCGKLKEALGDYINLYSDIASATDKNPYNYDEYKDQIKEIQDLYDEGIKTLKDADETATEL